jgi:hypothetical protein
MFLNIVYFIIIGSCKNGTAIVKITPTWFDESATFTFELGKMKCYWRTGIYAKWRKDQAQREGKADTSWFNRQDVGLKGVVGTCTNKIRSDENVLEAHKCLAVTPEKCGKVSRAKYEILLPQVLLKSGVLITAGVSAFIPPYYPGIISSIFAAFDLGAHTFKILQQIKLQGIDPYTRCQPSKHVVLEPYKDFKEFEDKISQASITFGALSAIYSLIDYTTKLLKLSEEPVKAVDHFGFVGIMLSLATTLIDKLANDKLTYSTSEFSGTSKKDVQEQSCIQANYDAIECKAGFAFCGVQSGMCFNMLVL